MTSLFLSLIFCWEFVVNLYMLATGLFQGWTQTESRYYLERSEMLPIMPVTMLAFGSIIGTILSGFVSMKFGRKMPVPCAFILITVRDSLKYWTSIQISKNVNFNKPFRFVSIQISCLLNMFARYSISLQISILLIGIFSGAMQNIAPLYLTEISNDR